jgi:D-beta-D-heptose 7-phosphate kinase/D-beta-D-heptose 1-phosphate adenosyltransferase
MKSNRLTRVRVKAILARAAKTRVLVVGDVMLDHFIWGRVGRISPEAPVPVVDLERENFIPGGAANVAHNLAALHTATDIFGVVGRDAAGAQLKRLLTGQKIGNAGLLAEAGRFTSVKTRIVAQQQQVVRLDRESRADLPPKTTRRMLGALAGALPGAAAVIIGDYGKGVVTQRLLDEIKRICRQRGIWLSVDPKPVHPLDLRGLSLVTPNRKEAFELAGIPDETRTANPLADSNLLRVMEKLLREIKPAILLITLGELGMLLCGSGRKPFHIPTIAQEVFDVSGAGDTVIATFTLAIAGGASPEEAAVISNHAAGMVVAKVGTATVSPAELIGSFQHK